MALNLVFFEKMPVTVLSVNNAERFLARLLTSDVRKMPVGGLERSVMLNATGGVIGLPWVVRKSLTDWDIVLTGEEADAEEAWIRQVAVAFDAEVEGVRLSGASFVGTLPVEGVALKPQTAIEACGLRFLSLSWINLVVGADEAVSALVDNLLRAGAHKGEKTGYDAMRIFAREPAIGLELTEGASPLETGLEDAVDFSDPERIFIGRALTEARAKAGNHLTMQLVAFDVAFDPNLLIEVPSISVEGQAYPLTSIARVPEGPFTVGLVRLPASVTIGAHLECSVTTDPRTFCKGALVVDRQI